jgi:hypothetical protein
MKKWILLLFAVISLSAFSQDLNLSGYFRNHEGLVRCTVRITDSLGNITVLKEEVKYNYYNYDLKQDLNYQIMFENQEFYKTLTIIPKSTGEYSMSINFALKEKPHCVLLYKEQDLYDMFLLTDKEFRDICAK